MTDKVLEYEVVYTTELCLFQPRGKFKKCNLEVLANDDRTKFSVIVRGGDILGEGDNPDVLVCQDSGVLAEILERVKMLEPIARDLQERDIRRHKLEAYRLLSPDAARQVLGGVIDTSLRRWDAGMTEAEAYRLIEDINAFCESRLTPEFPVHVRIIDDTDCGRGWRVETSVRTYRVSWNSPVVWEHMRERWLEICEALVQTEDPKEEKLSDGQVERKVPFSPEEPWAALQHEYLTRPRDPEEDLLFKVGDVWKDRWTSHLLQIGVVYNTQQKVDGRWLDGANKGRTLTFTMRELRKRADKQPPTEVAPMCEMCDDNGWNGRCPDCGRFGTDETLWEINQALIKRLKSGEPWISEREKELQQVMKERERKKKLAGEFKVGDIWKNNLAGDLIRVDCVDRLGECVHGCWLTGPTEDQVLTISMKTMRERYHKHLAGPPSTEGDLTT